MKSRTRKVLFILILLTELLLLVYFGSLKKGMHFDECFSYFNTNNSVGRQAYDRTYVSSYDIMKDFFVVKGEEFNYDYVVKLQSYDVHPPLFYIFLHTLCSFMPGVYSLWQGISLNILYTILSTIFIYLILRKFFNENIYPLVITLLYAINTGVICDMLYIRMYCLMTLFITIAVYLHVLMYETKSFNSIKLKFIILNSVLAYLGFMTHYFYLLFLFFIEACFFIPKLFKFKDHYKGMIKYFSGLLIAGILGIITYPSCLGHVNSGYRGQEVKGYLSDLTDIDSRLSFFIGLLNKFVFNGSFYILLLLIVLIFLFAYRKNINEQKTYNNVYLFFECILGPIIGYFLVSAKCSLIGDEAMMRYQLPVYGLSLVAVIMALIGLINYTIRDSKVNFYKYIPYTVLILIVVISIKGLVNKNVFYLYTEQDEMENIAKEHADETCIYIYNNEDQKYLLWNDAMQLAKYKEVYFVYSQNKEKIVDEKINNSEKLIVYISTLGADENIADIEQFIYDNNSNVTKANKLYEGMYATCYEFAG